MEVLLSLRLQKGDIGHTEKHYLLFRNTCILFQPLSLFARIYWECTLSGTGINSIVSLRKDVLGKVKNSMMPWLICATYHLVLLGIWWLKRKFAEKEVKSLFITTKSTVFVAENFLWEFQRNLLTSSSHHKFLVDPF